MTDWDEDYDEYDEANDDSAEWLTCPNCGAEIYEEAQRCPECGDYVTFSTSPWSGRPVWWLLLGALGAAAAAWALLR